MESPFPRKTVENEIATVKKYLETLNIFRPFSWQEIEEDPFRIGSYERYVFLLLQSTIDLAEAVVSLKKYRKPTSYSEMFEILLENKLIDTDMNHEMREFAKLRNAMTHDYEYLKPERLKRVLSLGYKVIEKFVQIAGEL